MTHKTHMSLQELLADVRAWIPVVVDISGTEHKITGVNILHEHDENASAEQFNEDGSPTKAAKVGVGAQVKAVITTAPAETESE